MIVLISLSRYDLLHSSLKSNNIPWGAICVFSIVFGIRYNVGIDHLAYLEMYQSYKIAGFDLDTEPGFGALIKLISFLDCHFSVFFFILAFLQLFLIFYALRKFPYLHNLLIITFFLLTTFLNFMNGIRQEVAFCFWVVAIDCLSNKKFWQYLLCVGLAITFHVSAVILLPIYFLYVKKDSYFNRLSFQIILMSIAIILSFMFNTTELLFGLVGEFAGILGYHGYVGMVIEGNSEFLEASRGIGLGFFVILLLNIIIITYSDRVKRYYNNRQYNIMYDLYFFGVIYMYLTNGSIALQRINYYFYNFNFIIGAFTLYYLIKQKTMKHTLSYLAMLVLYILLFSAIVIFRGAESCAIYNTFWSI